MPEQSAWTPERVEILKTMRARGDSATQIAMALGGVSRSAVIGKIDRMKLPLATVQNKKKPKPTRSKALRDEEHRQRTKLRHRDNAPPKPPTEAYVERDEPVPTTLVKLEDLGAHACKWPHGDPLLPTFGFCGAPADEGSPYCSAHHRRAYVPAKAVAN